MLPIVSAFAQASPTWIQIHRSKNRKQVIGRDGKRFETSLVEMHGLLRLMVSVRTHRVTMRHERKKARSCHRDKLAG